MRIFVSAFVLLFIGTIGVVIVFGERSAATSDPMIERQISRANASPTDCTLKRYRAKDFDGQWVWRSKKLCESR